MVTLAIKSQPPVRSDGLYQAKTVFKEITSAADNQEVLAVAADKQIAITGVTLISWKAGRAKLHWEGAASKHNHIEIWMSPETKGGGIGRQYDPAPLGDEGLGVQIDTTTTDDVWVKLEYIEVN